MELQRVAGLVIIASFVLFVLGFFVYPPGFSQETDLEGRLKIIAEHQSRWKLVMRIGGLQPLVTALGFLLLSISLRGSQNPWLLYLGAGAFIMAGLLAAVGINQTINDPVSYLDHSSQSPQTSGYILLTAVAGILYGIVFLQAGFPNWLAYITLGSAALVPFLVVFKSSVAYVVVVLFYFVTFVAGIVIVRQ